MFLSQFLYLSRVNSDSFVITSNKKQRVTKQFYDSCSLLRIADKRQRGGKVLNRLSHVHTVRSGP